MNDRQPSAMRAVWMIARLTLRRRLNIFQAVRAAPMVQGEEPTRTGTAPISPARSPTRGIMLVIAFSILFLGTFVTAFAGLANLSASSQESNGKILVNQKTYERLETALRGLWISGHFSNSCQRGFFEPEVDRFLGRVCVYAGRDRTFV